MKNLLIIILLFISTQLNANDNSIYLNPGIKLGYQIGKYGGFVYGFEVSVTHYGSRGGLLGIVANIDFCKDNTKLHFGFQQSILAGYEIGPTIYFERDNTYFGITATVFGFVFVMPYYEFSYIFDKNIILNQLGLFGKLPIPIKKGRYVYNIWE